MTNIELKFGLQKRYKAFHSGSSCADRNNRGVLNQTNNSLELKIVYTVLALYWLHILTLLLFGAIYCEVLESFLQEFGPCQLHFHDTFAIYLYGGKAFFFAIFKVFCRLAVSILIFFHCNEVSHSSRGY